LEQRISLALYAPSCSWRRPRPTGPLAGYRISQAPHAGSAAARLWRSRTQGSPDWRDHRREPRPSTAYTQL